MIIVGESVIKPVVKMFSQPRTRMTTPVDGWMTLTTNVTQDSIVTNTRVWLDLPAELTASVAYP